MNNLYFEGGWQRRMKDRKVTGPNCVEEDNRVGPFH